MVQPIPIRSGTKTHDSGESWVRWWLFQGHFTRNDLTDFLDSNDVFSYYGGPGAVFSRGAGIRHSRSYTLVRQYSGYDV